MRIPPWLRWLVGVATIWPMIWLVVVGVQIVRGVVETVQNRSSGASHVVIASDLGVSPVLASVTILIAAFAIGFSFWHLARSEPGKTPKPVWVLVLLMCGPVGYPIYWWARIRPPLPDER